MGEVVEMILDGILCEVCGALVDGSAAGYPRACEFCEDREEN